MRDRRLTVHAGMFISTFVVVGASAWYGCSSGTATRREPTRLQQPAVERRWLAGDHHIHTHFSVGWDREGEPPVPILGGDAVNEIPKLAQMARKHGLAWMVTTDHGGPNHSKLNLEQAYPELISSRAQVAEVLQFYGMELDTPGSDHSSLIIPRSPHEHTMLFELESRFSVKDAFPRDKSRDTEEKMIEALTYMNALQPKPIVIANHPSRSSPTPDSHGATQPGELRNWNDAAPHVSVGMEAAPGHQANSIVHDKTRPRGSYKTPTYGGFDWMTAQVGGVWDSLLGEGRRWWITATSDHHKHWRDGGGDFWPGEYSKTYVYAKFSYEDVLEGVRSGRVFVTTGDLVSEMFVTAVVAAEGGASASIGETLPVPVGSTVRVTIELRDPEAENGGGSQPSVTRVDLILGELEKGQARSGDTNPTAQVFKRFTSEGWKRDREVLTMSVDLPDVRRSIYLRVRGTSTDELEPQPDPKGEDPWTDLWFYSNPIFLEVQ